MATDGMAYSAVLYLDRADPAWPMYATLWSKSGSYLGVDGVPAPYAGHVESAFSYLRSQHASLRSVAQSESMQLGDDETVA